MIPVRRAEDVNKAVPGIGRRSYEILRFSQRFFSRSPTMLEKYERRAG